jgi:hypothetical protein
MLRFVHVTQPFHSFLVFLYTKKTGPTKTPCASSFSVAGYISLPCHNILYCTVWEKIKQQQQYGFKVFYARSALPFSPFSSIRQCIIIIQWRTFRNDSKSLCVIQIFHTRQIHADERSAQITKGS